MPDTFNARVGEITVRWERLGDDENTIQVRKDGQLVFRWPLTFYDLPIADFNEQDAARLGAEVAVDKKIRPRVIKAVLRRSKRYKNHPFVQRWIENNKETIAILRSAGVPWDDSRIEAAEDHLLKTVGRRELQAAKRPYSNDAVLARREDELLNAFKPTYEIWQKASKSGRSEEKRKRRGRGHPALTGEEKRERRKQRVLRASVPLGCNNGLAPNYDETLRAGIEKLVEAFEAKRDGLEDGEKLTPEKIVHDVLKKEFHVSLDYIRDNIRRGRQRLEPDVKGCPSCGSENKLHHNKDCPAQNKWEASLEKEQAEYDRRVKKEQAEQDRQRMSKKP
jgi:hypothetical protein